MAEPPTLWQMRNLSAPSHPEFDFKEKILLHLQCVNWGVISLNLFILFYLRYFKYLV